MKVSMAEDMIDDDDIIDDEEIQDELGELEDEESLEQFEDEGTPVEDLEPTDEIWPGGPTAAQIIAWKEQFGDVFVSSFTPEHHVVWRTMNRLEYRTHVSNMEQMTNSGTVSPAEAGLINEEAMCEICILYPPFNSASLPAELAGMPSALSQDIVEASGFVALEVRKL